MAKVTFDKARMPFCWLTVITTSLPRVEIEPVHSGCGRGQYLHRARAVGPDGRAQSQAWRGLCVLQHRYRPGDYEAWKLLAPVWGGEIRAEDVPRPGASVAREHWC